MHAYDGRQDDARHKLTSIAMTSAHMGHADTACSANLPVALIAPRQQVRST
jgi:hypothetical protein